MDNNVETARIIFNLTLILQKKLMRAIIQKSSISLSPLQVHVLYALNDKTFTTLTTLAKEIWITKQQLTGIIGILVKRGFARKEYDPYDGRVIRINSTEKGLTLLDRLNRETLEALNDKLEGLEQNDLSVLNEAVSQIVAIINGKC